jgi:cyclic pyranopterin phosphate synthase
MHRQRLTHQDESGRPRMVDVSEKAETDRVAVAEGVLRMEEATLENLLEGRSPKGDPLLVAQVAGIQAAKRTAELIPLCHPLSLSQVDVQLEADAAVPGVRATATVRVRGATGVEMEALTAVTVALLTAYDMLKGIEKGMQITGIRLLRKAGGRSGEWTARE